MRHCCISAQSEWRIWLTVQKVEGDNSSNFTSCRLKISLNLMEKTFVKSQRYKKTKCREGYSSDFKLGLEVMQAQLHMAGKWRPCQQRQASVRMCEVRSCIWGTLAQRTKKRISVQQMGHVCIMETQWKEELLNTA